IKQNLQYGSTPVILMSGVVNKAVADKAVSVQADELIRKPFQPQELISRVKSLLHLGPAPAAASSVNPLSGLFAQPVAQSPAAPPPAPSVAASPWPRALAEAFAPGSSPTPDGASAKKSLAPPLPQRPATTPGSDAQKLRLEIMRLELLVKKLQAELQI